jgi:hypothetical protein
MVPVPRPTAIAFLHSFVEGIGNSHTYPIFG